jgi:enoyl-CoA hydratase
MLTPTVLDERDGRIARVTRNPPERLNAIDDRMPAELRDAVRRVGEDDRVHDGGTRHTREGRAFKARREAVGFEEAARGRDSGVPLDRP